MCSMQENPKRVVELGWALQVDDMHNADSGKVPVRARWQQDLANRLGTWLQWRMMVNIAEWVQHSCGCSWKDKVIGRRQWNTAPGAEIGCFVFFIHSSVMASSSPLTWPLWKWDWHLFLWIKFRYIRERIYVYPLFKKPSLFLAINQKSSQTIQLREISEYKLWLELLWFGWKEDI